MGSYGVPSRETRDPLIDAIPAHFEAAEIHVAGLVVATYAGENYSHYLAQSSLGAWLKEQGVPALYGVDTRALTKKIRTEGSMLGRLLLEKSTVNALPNGTAREHTVGPSEWPAGFESLPWHDPNKDNLVAQGMLERGCVERTSHHCSILPKAVYLLARFVLGAQAFFRPKCSGPLRGCWT